MGSGRWSVVGGQWSLWSVVGGRWSVVVVSGQWSVVGGRWSVVGGRWSVVGGRWSVVGGRWSVSRMNDGLEGLASNARATLKSQASRHSWLIIHAFICFIIHHSFRFPLA